MGAFGPRRVPHRQLPNPLRLRHTGFKIMPAPFSTKPIWSSSIPSAPASATPSAKAQDKDFWGVDQDVKSLAQFITLYVSRNGRWNFPQIPDWRKATVPFASAALGNYLQETRRHGL